MREAVIAGDGFMQQMRARGWSVAETRPIYTDLAVIRQPWLICPNGARYGDRALYRLLDHTTFRKMLRLVLKPQSWRREQLAAVCSSQAECDMYLTFLQDQELIKTDGKLWYRGDRLFHVVDIGHTLEFFIAEWFRLTCSIMHLIPVRHGVILYAGFDSGDFDVVALLDSFIITVECKSAATISDAELTLFIRRARLLYPAPAILLLDISPAALAGKIPRFNALLIRENREPFMSVEHTNGLCWSAEHLYVTSVGQLLSTTLATILDVLEVQFTNL